MKSKIIFHFFIFLFGFFVGNLFPTFFGHIVGSITSFFLLLILEGFNFIGTCGGRRLRLGPANAGTRDVRGGPGWRNFGKGRSYALRSLRHAANTGGVAGFAERSYAEQGQNPRASFTNQSFAADQGPTGYASGPRSGFSSTNAQGQASGSLQSPREVSTKTLPHSVLLVSIFNSLKIGILFGLFVDAFKVGS